MNILILEDEKPAAEKLIRGIKRFDASVNVEGPLQSVREAVQWLTENPAPDLIFADIQLADGISFEIFRKVAVSSPVIFATAFDSYLLEALEQNSIDYLLKPVKEERLEGALRKYLRLKQHFSSNLQTFIEDYGKKNSKRERIVVKKGVDFVSVKIDEVAFFYTEHKIVFLVDNAGVRYVIDEPLSKLEEELDPSQFFRANRKFLINIRAVKRFKSYEKGKILVELVPATHEQVVVSQESAGEFKGWMGS